MEPSKRSKPIEIDYWRYYELLTAAVRLDFDVYEQTLVYAKRIGMPERFTYHDCEYEGDR